MYPPFGLIFLFLVLVTCADAKVFRRDYQHYPEVDGWLKLHRMPARWHDARLRCHSEGSALASPMTDKMVVAMRDVIEPQPLTIFTGIADAWSSGEYRSIEGEPIDAAAAPWAPLEPDNKNGQEQCIALFPNGTLTDVSCDTPLPYLCYRHNSTDLPNPSPCCGTVDPEYKYEESTGHCYKFHRNGQTWEKAHMICAAEGGYLAIMNSDEEIQILKKGAKKSHEKNIFILARHKYIFNIGFRDWSQHGVWMTIHGQTLQEAGYSRWGENQPSHSGDREFCGSLLESGELNDSPCEDTVPFVCEMEPIKLSLDSQSDFNVFNF